MDFRPTPDQEALRSEVRAFLRDDPAPKSRPFSEDGWIAGFDPAFSKRLAKRGWIGLTWPRAFGGSERSYLDRLIVTDTIALRDDAKDCGKIDVVSTAPLLSEAIRRINNEESVSSLFV